MGAKCMSCKYTSNMSDPIAYFLTWTCYGTWLHGDQRGSVDDNHNTLGYPLVKSNSTWVSHASSKLRHQPIKLSIIARKLITNTITDHCNYKSWNLYAINVRTNHVHVIVTAPKENPELVMRQFKSWATRHLRKSGIFSSDTKIWTHHGSTRYLWKEENVYAAINYVREYQD